MQIQIQIDTQIHTQIHIQTHILMYCQVAAEKAAILGEETLEEDSKAERVNNLTLDGAAIEDLGMTMEYSPSSRFAGGHKS